VRISGSEVDNLHCKAILSFWVNTSFLAKPSQHTRIFHRREWLRPMLQLEQMNRSAKNRVSQLIVIKRSFDWRAGHAFVPGFDTV